MNTDAITDAAIRLSKLTPQEHLFASELAQKLRVGDKPAAQPESAKQSPVGGSNRWHRHWTDEEHLALMQHIEDELTMTRSESKRKRRQIAKQLGRTVCAVNRKIQKLQGKK